MIGFAVGAAIVAAGSGPARAGCPEPTDAAALAEAVGRAEARFGSLDPAGFVDALREATLDLPCLADPVPPALAARYHTLVGLELYGDGQLEDARRSFAAARAAAPDRGLPVELVPAGHELHARYAEAPADGPRAPIPPPAAGELLFDGVARDSRPTDRPTIAQHVGGDGAVRDTRYLLPTDPLPPYEPAVVAVAAAPAAAPPPAPVDPRTRPRAGVRPPWGWLAASAVAGAGSLTLYVMSEQSVAEFNGELPQTVDEDGLEALKRRANRLLTGAGVAGAASAGGVVAFVVHWALKGPRTEP